MNKENNLAEVQTKINQILFREVLDKADGPVDATNKILSILVEMLSTHIGVGYRMGILSQDSVFAMLDIIKSHIWNKVTKAESISAEFIKELYEKQLNKK